MLLALDTSTRFIGIAVFDGETILYEIVWQSRNNHTIELAPAVAEALGRAGVAVSDLTAVGIATGPGSFTSLRIGMALAKGLALSRGIPLVGIPTLDVIAMAQPISKASLAAVLQAGRGRLAVGWYHVIAGDWKPTGEIAILTPEALSQRIRKTTIVCGEIDPQTRKLVGRKYKNVEISRPPHALRRAAVLADLAWERLQQDQPDNAATLSPFYFSEASSK
ncbi:MAG: tRNA (adenosine(37)-N6)-threonylcarbamoyltransferase complex dimerization subunit type 1 TsaB [Anaerolineales bacterium]|nr:tRNA (adenosine(37)-N6)-threonylcarbamoyltransferase complex dimerization subunit type 1 TsaB [Anaerolineales bacterium]